MSTNQTKNLKLHSWAPLDRFTREEFNANWAGIDAAWGDLDGRLLADVEALSAETAARKTADTTLQKNIDAKATAAALTTETSERKAADTTETNARTAADNALANRATALENRAATLETQMTARPCIVSGKYTGTGEIGKFSSQEIKLNFKPLVVFVRPRDDYVSQFNVARSAFALEKQSALFNNGNELLLNDTGFQVYNSASGSQLNVSGTEYQYVALG